MEPALKWDIRESGSGDYERRQHGGYDRRQPFRASDLRRLIGEDISFKLLYEERNWIMAMARLLVILTCIVWFGAFFILPPPIAKAQQQPSHAIAVDANMAAQQAATQVAVIDSAKDIAKLQTQVDSMNSTISTLREELSSVKGMGMGAAGIIGLLQTVQMLLQTRKIKQS